MGSSRTNRRCQIVCHGIRGFSLVPVINKMVSCGPVSCASAPT